MAEKTNIVKEVNNNEKGTALQAVKAVAVLVVICLVCCLLLALCNDLLYVTEEEKFNRAMKDLSRVLFGGRSGSGQQILLQRHLRRSSERG